MTQKASDLLPAFLEQLREANKVVSAMWSKSQEEYFSNYMPASREDVDLSLFSHLLPAAPARVLDLGCNNGEIVMALRGKGYDAYGVDLPQVIRRVIETYYPYYASDWLLPCNLEKDELPVGKFQLVLALAVIEHIINWKILLRTVYQALTPAGVFFLTSCDSHVIARDPWHWRHFTVEELKEEATEAGFSDAQGYSDGPSLRMVLKRGEI